MNRKLITLGFLRMLPPPSKPLAPDPIEAATMQRRIEESHWRQYDSPACRRFVSPRHKKPAPLRIVRVTVDDLPSFLRRQAE